MPILGTSNIAEWLKSVFENYKSFYNALQTEKDIPLDRIIFPKFEDGRDYILPERFSCDDMTVAVMPESEAMKAAYDLRVNYGRIIKSQVNQLLPELQRTFFGFANTVETKRGEDPVGPLSALENSLRLMLRAALSEADITAYPNIANDIVTLSDVTSYPLYIWAITPDEGDISDIKPVLVPEEKIREMSEPVVAAASMPTAGPSPLVGSAI